MGRHRRRDQMIAPALAGYEHVLLLLHTHRPGRRSELCLVCGQRWPCLLLRRTIDNLAHGHRPPNRPTPTMNDQPRTAAHLPAHTEPVRRGGWFGEPQAQAEAANTAATTTSTRATAGTASPPSTRPRGEIPTGSNDYEVMQRVVTGIRRLDDRDRPAPSATAVDVEPQ